MIGMDGVSVDADHGVDIIRLSINMPKLIANSYIQIILLKNDSCGKLTLIEKAQLHHLRQTAPLLAHFRILQQLPNVVQEHV
jgi:hypothetical protein